MKSYTIASFVTLFLIALARFYPSKAINFIVTVGLFLIPVLLALLATFSDRTQGKSRS
jgi:hypothetical protein